MHLLQVVLLLGAVLAVTAIDPTTICFPSVFQIPYFNMISGDKGTIYVDFSKELWAEFSSVSGVRTISDFTHLRSYVLSGQGNDTVCQSFKLRQDQIMSRCLPPFATLIPEATGTSHRLVYEYMYVQTWDIPTEYDTIYRVMFTVISGTTYWPIMSQQYGYHGTTDMYIYINPVETISDTTIFDIPEDCIFKDINLATMVG